VRAAVRAGVATVAVAGLLAACGDDKGGEGDAASVGDFCAQMERMNVELDSRGWFESADGSDQDTIDAVGSVDPPAEISQEWGTVVELTERSAEVRSEGGEAEETGDSEAAAERVVSYVDVQCSVDLGSS
jgi:hypothetical protein